jgi:NADPH:quinone reductase-like Zn-dependent oxidoreductase
MKDRRIIIARKDRALQMIENDLPEPQSGMVRVKVLAAGVAFGDLLYRSIVWGKMPRTPGYDIVGVVDACGAGVTEPAIGQLVAALPVRGGYTEYINLPSTELIQLPADLDPAEAVCVLLNYLTAHQLLYRVAHVQEGQRILIHGAAGGVGTALLQLGRLAGLEMYGTASQGKQQVIRDLGGIPIDYRNEDVVARLQAVGGVDVVFDAITGVRHLWRSYHTLRSGGQLVCYGFSSAVSNATINVGTVLASALLLAALLIVPGRRIKLYGVTQMKDRHPQWYRQDVSTLLDLLAHKSIQPLIARRLPLSQAAQAHELLERSAVIGKIILLPDSQ